MSGQTDRLEAIRKRRDERVAQRKSACSCISGRLGLCWQCMDEIRFEEERADFDVLLRVVEAADELAEASSSKLVNLSGALAKYREVRHGS